MYEHGGLQQLGDVHYFTNELVNGLKQVRDGLCEEFHNLKASDFRYWERKPYNLIFDRQSWCPAKCPFCNEPCMYSAHGNNVNHEVYLHCPQCLAGWHNDYSQIMALKTCSK